VRPHWFPIVYLYRNLMNISQILALLVGKLTIYTVGLGLASLLPVYASRLGGSPEFIGYYLSSALFCLCLGTIAAGWLSNRLHRYKYLLCCGAAAYSPALFLMSQAQNVWQLAVFTDIVWFLGGSGLALANIILGLTTDEKERGKAFGLLELSQGLGGLIGGLKIGPLADALGYPRMIMVVATFSLLWLVASFFVQEPRIQATKQEDPQSTQTSQKASPRMSGFSLAFYSLLLSSGIVTAIQFVDALARPLYMDSLNFDATAINRIATSVAVSLPWLLILGWLCDHLKQQRVWLLVGCYLIGAVGMLATAVSTQLWEFWLTAALINLVPPSLLTIASTWISDRMPREQLGIALSWFNLTLWLPGVFGLAITGNLIRLVGIQQAFTLTAFMPLLACLMLIPIMREDRPKKEISMG